MAWAKKSVFWPLGYGSAYQMAAGWKDSGWSPWFCFCSVWGRCPAEMGEQMLRCALSAEHSAGLCNL